LSDLHFQRSYRGPLKAAILDWAGTTVDYGCCAPAVVFIEVFKRKGVEISLEEARGPMGAEKRQHILEISEVPRVAAAWAHVHGGLSTHADIDAMYAEFVPLQIDCLKDYATLITGTHRAAESFAHRGMLIGSTSGYNREMMEVLVPLAAEQGYTPDSVVSASEVPMGRPAPWMALKSAEQLGVYPLEAIVKIGDTVPDIAEGLNGGMWTVGITKTGNELGLTLAEAEALSEEELAPRLARAHDKLAAAGAHFVIEGLEEIEPVLDAINARLRSGERP